MGEGECMDVGMGSTVVDFNMYPISMSKPMTMRTDGHGHGYGHGYGCWYGCGFGYRYRGYETGCKHGCGDGQYSHWFDMYPISMSKPMTMRTDGHGHGYGYGYGCWYGYTVRFLLSNF